MTTTVTLGLVKLQSFEIPAAIGYGGKQRLAVHDLPGGGRVIDVLGGADGDITFAGVISGRDAQTRAQLLNALRVSGAAAPLSWGEQYYLVVIAEAEFDFRKPWWIPYRLRCAVQSNLIYAGVATAASAAASIGANLSTAASALGSMPDALAAAQSALAQPGSTTYGTASYGQAISAISTAQSSITSKAMTTGVPLPMTDIGFADTDPAAAATTMMGAVQTAGSLAALMTARSYVGSGLSALQNIGT